MGCNRGTDVAHLRDLLERTLADHGLALDSVAAITTVDLKAGEIGLLQLVRQLGVKLIDYPAEELAAQPVPTPSAMVEGHVGTPSVAEASVVAHGAELIVAKQRSTDATCAVGRIPARGRLSVVGLGPGVRDLLTPRAKERLQQATFVVGYGPYVKQIRDLIRSGVRVMASKMGTEEARTSAAIEAARNGENVCRSSAPSATFAFTSGESVAAITYQVPSRSASSNSRASHVTRPAATNASSAPVISGETILTRAPDSTSRDTRRLATFPPPTTSTSRPPSISPAR